MSPTSFRRGAALLASAIATLPVFAQVPYTGGTYEEHFDGLPTTSQTGFFPLASSVGDPISVTGLTTWAATANFRNSSTAADFKADTGSLSNGALYSYGAASVAERALGAVASGSYAMSFGTEIVNNTGGTISKVTISFTAETWRSSTSVRNRLVFSYGSSGDGITSSNYLSSSSMTALPALDAVEPAADVVTSNGAVNGNDSAHRAVATATITGLAIPNGGSLYIRWADTNDGGNDAGVAIDDFSLTATVGASGSDVSLGAANTLFTPTSFGGNPFTAADTAVFDGSSAAVTVSGQVEAFALKFTTDGYTVSGGASDSLAVQGATFVDSALSATISAVLAGVDGFKKTGAGTLTLTGANTFTGAASISSGRLIIGADSALGVSDNDLTVNGTLQITASSFTLGAGRALSGSGMIETPASGNLTIAGPIAADPGSTLTFSGPSSLTLSGATKTLGTLVLSDTVALNITGAALTPTTSAPVSGASGGLIFNQGGGTSVVTGDIAFGPTGDRALLVNAGTVEIDGAISLGGRLIKTGSGTLDLTGGTLSGTTSTNGGVRLGVQGGSAYDGGTLIIDSGADLGNLTMHANSGTLHATQPITSAVGLSIGSRRGSSVSPLVLEGADMVFNGTVSSGAGFFNSGTGLGFNVNNTTTLAYNIPVIGASPVGWVEMGGTGTLIYTGNASPLIDNYAVTDSLTFVMNGTFGGKLLAVDPNATLAGHGTFTGSPTEQSSSLATVDGKLAPTGLLTFDSSLTLHGTSTTVLDIAGLTRGSEYDSVAVLNPDTTGAFGYILTYGGALTLNFTASATNGTYTLFETGANVTRSGSFSSVGLSGSYSGALSASGAVWSGTVSGTTFSFDESTGVLTVTGGGSAHTALETWRFEKFGVYADTAEVLAGDNEDYDGDGMPNLLEYATGGDPTVAGVSLVTQGKSGDFLTLSFPVISDSSLTYTVQATSDLATVFTTGGGSTNTVSGVTTYTDNVSISTAGVRRFLRLHVSYPVE